MNTSKHYFPVERIPAALRKKIRFIGVACDNRIKPWHLVLNLLFSREPYIAQRYHIRAYGEKLSELLSEETFDIIQLEGPYLGYYIPIIKTLSRAPVSLRAHNVEHLIWKKKAGNDSSLLKRWYFRNMASRLEKFELTVIDQTDCLVPISPLDATYFRERGYQQPLITIPAGFILDAYPQTPLPSKATLFFIGALDWMPNQEGLLWFVEKVFNQLVAELPQIEFHVAGRNAPDHIIRKLSHESIVFHGEIENAVLFMQSYRIMVAPLFTGSGIRIKILEGMGLGRPVVTTPVGIAGIPAENNREVVVADNPEDFKYQLIKLLLNDEEANRLVRHARALIKENFDTFGLSSRLNQFFKTEV